MPLSDGVVAGNTAALGVAVVGVFAGVGIEGADVGVGAFAAGPETGGIVVDAAFEDTAAGLMGFLRPERADSFAVGNPGTLCLDPSRIWALLGMGP